MLSPRKERDLMRVMRDGSYESEGGEKRFRVHSKGEYSCKAESERECIVTGL